MSLSTDVRLPRDTEPAWPDRCVCCGRPGPGGRVRVWTASIGGLTFLLWHPGSLYRVAVPACPPCGRRLRARRLGKLVLTWTLCLAGFAAGLWLLGSYAGAMKKWLVALAAGVAVLPLLLWGMFFPPAFDLTCFQLTVTYEFRDPGYAAEFEALNRAEATGGGRGS